MSEKTSSWCCAACGIAEIDDIKLKECDGCDLVKYCGDECRRDHKLVHEEECKKRAAELRDELLFKQPESTHKRGTVRFAVYLCRLMLRNST